MRVLQIAGLPPEAKKILCEKFISESGEEVWIPRYKKRLRGYTVSLFYYDRAPLYEYYEDKPPHISHISGEADGPYLFRPKYHEELQGAPWSSGPVAHMQLVESDTLRIVAAWPVSEYGSVISEHFE